MAGKNVPKSWLYCHNLQEWSDWLLEHHQQETEIWLKIKKAKSVEEGLTLSEAVNEAIRFGWIDGKVYGHDTKSYLLRLTPRKPGSLWSMINRQRAEVLIADGRMTEAGMEAIRDAQRRGNWQGAYTAKEKPEIPADLEASLKKDPPAWSNFNAWSNSDQLQAIGWIQQSKRQLTRQNRIEKVVLCSHNNQKLIQEK